MRSIILNKIYKIVYNKSEKSPVMYFDDIYYITMNKYKQPYFKKITGVVHYA